MRVNAMQMQQMQAQQQARRQAGQVLYDQMGQQAPAVPPPPAQAPAPPPGSLSPGGGNPMAPGGASAMAPPGPQMQPGSAIPPPPMLQGGAQQPMMQPGGAPMGVVPPPPGAQPGGAPMGQMPPQIQPFRPMPSQPPGGAPGQVPPPPAAPAANDGVQQPRPFDLRSIVQGLQKSGVKSDQVMNMLDTLAPAMNTQNRQELDFFKANNAALKAANEIYIKTLNAATQSRKVDVAEDAEDRRGRQGDRNLDIKADKEARLKASAAAAVGGSGFLKTTELVYPKGANGQPDQTQPPIGVRAITKTGKIVNLDAEGHQVPTLAGATAKEGKASQVNVRDTVRGNLVEGSAFNAINRLKEIEEKFPTGTTSLLFGRSADSVLSGAGHAAMRGAQSADQQDLDAKWSSFIDEAIPVFTGGLRGSDAFRRFLIEQAPGPNTKPEVVKEKMRLFRENIKGTQRAFANKFATDPKMWAPGVTKEQVQGPTAPRGGSAPAPGAVQDGYRFNGGDPGKPESWEKVK